MTRQTDRTTLGRPRLFLSARDWVYLLSLLVPLAFYDLLLKGSLVAGLPDEHGVLGGLVLLRSDLLFNAGYALLWIGLFMVFGKGLARATTIVLFHGITLVVVLITAGAERFFEVTGSTLDYGTIAYALSSPGGTGGAVASAVTPGLLVAVVATLTYALFGPWLLTRAAARWLRPAAPGRFSWVGLSGVCLVAYALLSLSLVPGGGPADASDAFSRDPLVNVVLPGVATARADGVDSLTARKVAESLPTETRLEPTLDTEKRNVVLISLESTRARSVTPYNPDLKITPFMSELAGESLFAERAYSVVPHTTNALVASICGIYPPYTPRGTDSLGDRIPARCLADLLKERGYRTAYFTSSVQTFERRPEVVENMGYEEFYPVETMDKEGFQKANYFGYEDDIMLEPSKEWLEKNGKKGPFFAMYDTITPHHEYLAPGRYGIKDFAEDDQLNGYLNGVRYVDFFLKNLIEQYKEMGLYDDTVFVIFGDHGEAFAEHGVRGHDGVPYEEGLRVPFIIHDPRKFQDGERIEGILWNQLDLPPTVLDMLGYEAVNGEYSGRSMFGLPEERTLFASCRPDLQCAASIQGNEKYIYHYGKQPEEFYDLSEDPLEQNNLADEVGAEELKRRRTELLEWRSRVRAMYDEEAPRSQ